MFSKNSLYCKVAEQMPFSEFSFCFKFCFHTDSDRQKHAHTNMYLVGMWVHMYILSLNTDSRKNSYIRMQFHFLNLNNIFSTKSGDDHHQTTKKQKWTRKKNNLNRIQKNTDRFKCSKTFYFFLLFVEDIFGHLHFTTLGKFLVSFFNFIFSVSSKNIQLNCTLFTSTHT